MSTTPSTATPQSPFLPFRIRMVMEATDGRQFTVNEDDAAELYGAEVADGTYRHLGFAVCTIEPSDGRIWRVSSIHKDRAQSVAWIEGRTSGEAQGAELVADALQSMNAELRESLRRATIQLRSIYELCKQRNLFEVTIPMWQEQIDREALMKRLGETCPWCGNDRDGGVHTDTCRLAAALKVTQ
jgi:hypothetical protein